MAGPAYPLFRSSLLFSLSPSLIGPACHCGRSRLFFPPFYLPHPPRPFISLSSVAFWLKLPSRLKILVKNSTSVLSIHLDQVSARSVGWPLVYFLPLNCPVTGCLDPFFHLHKFFHLLPLFYIIGPAYHCGRSRLSPSSTFPTPFSLHPTGPACHCGRSRLSPSSTFPTPFPLPPTGPACHCGRSRLFPFLSLL